MEMVELAMAELVHRNRQLTHELTRATCNSTGTTKRTRVKAKRESTKVSRHDWVGGSSSEGAVGGIHAYSQGEGELRTSTGGVRRKLEKVRESLCLAGHSTAVKDRPGIVGNSERTTASQNRALTRVAMLSNKQRPVRGVRGFVRDD
eukprot:Tamp_26225.p1 GENE.Tamp_26225~~Tamp_26225.p1  ORF type:complete len:157 (-),score=21.29 Tamp_26225:438-878(-)